MGVRVLTRVAGVLGGLCWVGRAGFDTADGSDSVVNALHWGGLALIVIALVGIALALVSASAWWLRVVIAVCLSAFVWALLEWLHGQYSDRWVDGVFGVLFALFCLAGLAVRRERPQLG